jgi:hypothetical protein
VLAGAASAVLAMLLALNGAFGVLLGGCFHGCGSSASTGLVAMGLVVGGVLLAGAGWFAAGRSWAAWGVWVGAFAGAVVLVASL